MVAMIWRFFTTATVGSTVRKSCRCSCSFLLVVVDHRRFDPGGLLARLDDHDAAVGLVVLAVDRRAVDRGVDQHHRTLRRLRKLDVEGDRRAVFPRVLDRNLDADIRRRRGRGILDRGDIFGGLAVDAVRRGLVDGHGGDRLRAALAGVLGRGRGGLHVVGVLLRLSRFRLWILRLWLLRLRFLRRRPPARPGR